MSHNSHSRNANVPHYIRVYRLIKGKEIKSSGTSMKTQKLVIKTLGQFISMYFSVLFGY